MSEELIPCPFCGGIPEVHKHFREDAHSLVHRCPIVGYLSFEFGDRERNAELWNTRYKKGQ